MIVVWVLHLVLMLYRGSYECMIWSSYAVVIRYILHAFLCTNPVIQIISFHYSPREKNYRSLRTDMNFSQSDSWSHCFPHPITVVNSITLAVWWPLMNHCCVRFRSVHKNLKFSLHIVSGLCYKVTDSIFSSIDSQTIREEGKISVQFDKQRQSNQLSEVKWQKEFAATDHKRVRFME